MSLQNPTELGAPRRPFEQPPPEILQVIFERVIPPNFLADLSTSFSPNSLWCRVLQQKLSLLNVCWAWYRIGISFLYEDVAIRRIYQLGNLLRTLESSDSSYLKDMIKTLDVHCFIPRSFYGVFKMQLNQLFKICPRLTSFSHTSPCHPPSLAALPSLPQTLTHLELGEGIDLPILQEVLKSLSTNLVSLSIYITDLHDSNSYSFPRLESLSINRNQLFSSWELPSLRSLTLRMNFWPQSFSWDDLRPFLEKNGAQLKFFHIHPETECGCMSEFTIEIENILKSCPSLERFVLHPRPVPPITHQSIKWFRVGSYLWDLRLPHTRSQHRIVTAAFPSLKTLRKPSQSWTTWDECFRNHFPPTVKKIRGIHQCLGVDVHEDAGEIFVYVSDMIWTDRADDRCEPSSSLEEDSSEEDDSESDWEIGSDMVWTDRADGGYEPSSSSEEDDSESDWEVGSEKGIDRTWDAQMDLLLQPGLDIS